MANFDGTDDYFDSREVIERIAELEEIAAAEMTVDERDEYNALITLQEDAEGYISDWQYGETFYTWEGLVEYAEETVNECYTTGDLPSWVTNHIDWEAVAEEIKVDYTEFEFRGTTYYAR